MLPIYADMQQYLVFNFQPAVICEDFFLYHWQVLSTALEAINKMTGIIMFLGISARAQTPLAAQELQGFFSVLKYFTTVPYNHTKALIRKMSLLCTLRMPDTLSTSSTPSLPLLSHCPHVQVSKNAVQGQKRKPSQAPACSLSTCLETSPQQVKKPTKNQNITEQTNMKYPNSFACISIGELKLTPCIDYLGVSTGKYTFKNSKF